MSGIINYLEFLVGASRDALGGDGRVLEEWENVKYVVKLLIQVFPNRSLFTT